MITGFGQLAFDFLEENMLIVFDENAPEELAEISALHTHCDLEKDITVGDIVKLGNKVYTVTAVGSEANQTFKSMGHCCLMFTGNDAVALPGQIELKGDGNPDLKIADAFEIDFKE